MFRVERAQRGDQPAVTLRDDDAGSSATILPGFGFNCISFCCVLDSVERDFLYAAPTFPSADDKPTHNGTPILAPFPNRIRKGQFRFEGRSYSLPCNELGKNAIHGFAVDQPWRVTDESTGPDGAQATGEFQLSIDRAEMLELWPSDFRLAFTYLLRGHRLETRIVVENPGDRVLPFGVGTHPYFRFPLEESGALEQCELVSPAAKEVELIDCLPTGVLRDVSPAADLRYGKSLAERTFDDVYYDMKPSGDGMIRHLLRDRQAKAELEVAHGAEFPYSVIYTPAHRQAVCIEPYTCVTDAVNLEGAMPTHLWRLHPGEIRHLTIRYDARDYQG